MPHHAIVLYVGEDFEKQIYNMEPLVETLRAQQKPYRDPNTQNKLTSDQIDYINRQYRLFSGIKKNIL